MRLHQIREAVMYVAKFLAINLELDPPDCAGLGDDPEDVSTPFPLHSDINDFTFFYRSK